MPGLAGVISTGRLERGEDAIDAFSKVQALQGVSFIERRLRSASCAILNTLTGILKETIDQPATDADRKVHLFLEGEVYNTDELTPLVHLPRHEAPCRTLLALFLQRGPDFAGLLDGNFNIVLYEERERRLTIVNDVISIKPLYYLEEAGTLYFASEKKCILAAREGATRIDPVGLLQIFAHRHNLSGRTSIDGIKRLPAGSQLTWAEGRLGIRRYARPRYDASGPRPPVRQLVDEWCECLRADVARRLRGKERILLSLSGGLDSRAVACAIARDLRPLTARTRGAADSLEYLCAARVAEALGFTQFRDDPSNVPYSSILPMAVWRTECEVSFLKCTSLPDHDRIKAHGDIILGGQAGEIPAGGHIYPYMLIPGSRDTFLDRVFHTYSLYREPMLGRVFSDGFLKANYPLVRDEFRSSFHFLEGERHVDAYQIWELLERIPRMTLCPGAVDSHLFEKIYALLGRDYLNFTFRLPLHLRYGQTLYQAMIHRLGPEVRDVPYANTGLRLRRTVLGNLLNKGADLSGKAVKLLGRKLGVVTGKKRPAAVENITSALRSDAVFRRSIEDFLRSEACDGSVFNVRGISGLLDEHQGGKADHAPLLCLLATFAVGLPWFVHGRPRACPHEAAAPIVTGPARIPLSVTP